MIIPTESQEQIALFEWARWQIAKHPELEFLHHIPNGGKRDKVTAAKLKTEGVSAGVPDICLPAPRGKWHGLYIELKRQRGGKLSEEQKKWLRFLKKQGYFVAACEGWEEARDMIFGYLNDNS